MPTYRYEHLDADCSCELGRAFPLTQSIKDEAPATCPKCGAAIQRLISTPYINTPQSDSDLKNIGFTKLVKRDQGVYENVTALDGESRYMEADKPETMPHIKKRISD